MGQAVAGPATSVPAALLSGLVAGGVIGVGQGLALRLRPKELGLWAGATAIGLAVGLAAVTAIFGPIETAQDAVLLGLISGLSVGTGQAWILRRERLGNEWLWVIVSGVAWAVGWLFTASTGISLAPGWPVYGLTGAIVSQVITAIAVWRLIAQSEAALPRE